jgi:hypothetical protein
MTTRLKTFIQAIVPLRFGMKKERFELFSLLSGSGSGLSADFEQALRADSSVPNVNHLAVAEESQKLKGARV